MYVHPRCKNTIKGFRSVTYKEGAEDFVVDKDPGLEHWIDGCGYLILSAMNQVKPWKVGQWHEPPSAPDMVSRPSPIPAPARAPVWA